ncbi:PREDICTED: uncharacterized protein LOC108771187 [Cyphomyrmex costatus]|uniref:Protein ITFG3 n=1 Tax=Cyphomyrmex costatus TaxID=456900 RepID=A0A151K290_9HYME|nr:PREDICTED: uncharacterized protein LOC108771187 [Cyphomyrmex costatus]KYN50192.1 hypothetical protein ALC62_03821 [Cyphomyrmex costatus]
MSAVYPTLPKLAVRDNLDEDDLTDIDDEVFIRDGRSGGLKLDDDGGVKQPLMAPRRKCKKPFNLENHKIPYNMLLVPVCCGTAALIVLLGLIVVCIFTANIFPMPLTVLKSWISHDLKTPVNESEIIPCTSLSSNVLWARSFPKLTPEAPLRSNDVNSDGIEDIIVGFSTGLDMMDTEYICTIYFGNQTPCLGGVLALNGKTGEPIWTHWTAHSILSVDCDADLTNDKIKDCIISGRGGILQAINGHDGSSIWEIPLQDLISELQIISDVYDARFIADMDGDGIADVIASHVIQSDNIQASNVLVISGRSGSVIHNMNLPDTEQLFIAPQIIVHPDGENVFVLATTSQQDSGGLYVVSQANIFYGDLQLQKLNHNTGKNALLPPILIDITSDGIEDIVAAMFNSTIIAYNGTTFEPIWNYTIPNSEVISIPIPGYYNDDDIPDFMVKHQIGTGLSTYYYTMATVIDGRNGQPLLEKPMEDSLSGQMSGLSVTVDGFGNDWFLHWSTDCLNYEGIKEKYQFLKGQSFMSQTRTDLCSLRFNSTLTMRLLALSQHVGPPGLSLYFSEDWKSVEFNNSVDLREQEEKKSHSRSKITNTYANIPLVSERSPKIHKNHRKDSIFKHKDSLLEIGKYDSDAVYENFDEFKSHKKHNPEDTIENLNVDQAWKQDNKWMEDIQPDKEYDSLYENDNGNNEDGQQNVDYSQGEVREQRSVSVDKDPYSINISHKEINSTPESTIHDLQLDYEEINIGEKEEIEKEIIDKKNVSLNEADDIMNISMTSISQSQEESSTISNNKLNIEKITTIQNVSKTSELIEIKSTNISTELPENTRTEASNVTKDQIITDHPDATPITKKVLDVTRQRHIYRYGFSISQDSDEADIEKVFKRESLKNQNIGKINKKQLLILSSTDKIDKIRQKRRTKRNSRIKDNQSKNFNGVQKQAPTGILLPSIIESKGKTSIDLVFPTFWLPSSEVSLILSRADVECIDKKKALLDDKLEYKKNDDIISECLSERGINYRLYQEAMDRENTKVAFGQMTIYRMKLECVCPEDMLPNQTCKNISTHQSWPEYLGSSGNGYFKSLN